MLNKITEPEQQLYSAQNNCCESVHFVGLLFLFIFFSFQNSNLSNAKIYHPLIFTNLTTHFVLAFMMNIALTECLPLFKKKYKIIKV